MKPVKAIPWGKFIALQTYLKKQEKFQIKNLTLYLKVLEKGQQSAEWKKGNDKDQSRNKWNTL